MDTIAVDIFGQAAMKNTGMEITGSKVAAVTFAFWVMKIAATTLGETAGDLLSMTLNLGYALSSAILVAAFIALLMLQLSVRRFHPVLFWSVVLAASTAGTTISDLLDRLVTFSLFQHRMERVH